MATALARHAPQNFLDAGRIERSADKVGCMLESIATRAGIARGRIIFHQGDEAKYCYKVLSGTVSICKLLADGRRQIVDFLVPGDFFGFGEPGARDCTAEAVSDVIVASYPLGSLDRLASAHPAVCRWLLGATCRELTAAHNQMVMLGRKTAMERLASFFLAYAERLERAGSRCQPLCLPMRRVDIADYLGLTLETVSRTLGTLKQLGVVELHRHDEVTFRNRTVLKQLAEAE